MFSGFTEEDLKEANKPVKRKGQVYINVINVFIFKFYVLFLDIPRKPLVAKSISKSPNKNEVEKLPPQALLSTKKENEVKGILVGFQLMLMMMMSLGQK